MGKSHGDALGRAGTWRQSGLVLDQHGRPVSDARIMLEAGPVALPDVAMLCDELGHFALELPVAGRYTIQVLSDLAGMRRVTVHCPAPGSRASPLRIILPGG